MIANPQLAQHFYRYDPYTATLTREGYGYIEMHTMRREAIDQARLPSAKTFGIIQGTLGRQGSPAVVLYLRDLAKKRGKRVVVLLMSEVIPERLARFDHVDVWVQTSCPRLR